MAQPIQVHPHPESVPGAIPMLGGRGDYDPLIDRIGDRRYVLLGEATHGTSEFYRERARITKRLVEEEGFSAVAVEGDWPDAYRVNRYVLGASDDVDATAALGGFGRFPTWMWRNEDVVDLVEWLRGFNDELADETRKVRFYGLDLYSLRTSMEAVITFLNEVDPPAAAEARNRYTCFDHVGSCGVEYGRAVMLDPLTSCEHDVIEVLLDLYHTRAAALSRDGWAARDEYFVAQQNARAVLDAERYYRTMYYGRTSAWNVRDRHMARTLFELARHLDGLWRRSKIVVWEHNSHVGDSRATEMGTIGELTVGQLVREDADDEAVLVGFTTSEGQVTAASSWGAEAERKRIRPAAEGSYESFFHHTGPDQFMVLLGAKSGDPLPGPLLQRAIGVVYRTETEMVSHYLQSKLTAQFDVVVHLDRTTPVVPLERTAIWEEGEPPETFPTGL